MNTLTKLMILDFIQYLIEDEGKEVTGFFIREDGKACTIHFGDTRAYLEPVTSHSGICYVRLENTIYGKTKDTELDRLWYKLMTI